MPTLKELKLGSIASIPHKSKTIRLVKALARHHGYEVMVADVERRESHSGHTHDLFGIIDVLVVQGDLHRGIQVCGSDWQPHIEKFRDERVMSCKRWLESPYRTLELWGWRKVCAVKADGTKSKQKVWTPKVQLITWEFLMGNEKAQMKANGRFKETGQARAGFDGWTDRIEGVGIFHRPP